MAKALQTTRTTVTVYNFVDQKTDGTAATTTKDILDGGPTPVTSSDDNRSTWLRTRIDWTNDASGLITVDANAGSSSSVGLANIFQVLKIPDKTVLLDAYVGAPSDSTAPTHSYTGAGGAALLLNFQVNAYTTASKSTFGADADGLGTLAVTNSGGAMAGLPTISASTPETRMKALTTSSAGTPIYCRYGGYVELQLTGGASTSGITGDGAFAGDMDIMVRCARIPD